MNDFDVDLTAKDSEGKNAADWINFLLGNYDFSKTEVMLLTLNLKMLENSIKSVKNLRDLMN